MTQIGVIASQAIITKPQRKLISNITTHLYLVQRFIDKNAPFFPRIGCRDKNMLLRNVLMTASITVTLLLGSAPSWSLTGDEVLEKMSGPEQTAYMFGSMEMAAFLAYLAGEKERSQCITEWFNDKGVSQIIQTMSKLRDRQAQPIIHTLIGRACGKSETIPE